MPMTELNGASIAYREQGSGRPALFIHGTGTYSALFDPVLEELPADVRAIVYDRRGFGASEGPPARGLGVHVEDAVALIEKLDVGPATVVGSSAGGVLALRVAAERPDLVSSLVLIEPAYQMGLTPSVSANLALTRVYTRWLVRRDPESAALHFYRWATGYAAGGNQFDSYPDRWQKQGAAHARTALHELAQLVSPAPPRSALRSIAVPTSIVIGDAGLPVFHRTSRRVLRSIPGAAEIAAPGAAHLVYTDQPQICAQAIADTIERTT